MRHVYARRVELRHGTAQGNALPRELVRYGKAQRDPTRHVMAQLDQITGDTLRHSTSQ